MSIPFTSGTPVPSLLNTNWDLTRRQPFPASLSDHLEVCDTTSVRSFPLSALGNLDPKNLPLLPQSPGLARLQGKTASDLMSFTPKSKAQPAPVSLASTFQPKVCAVSTQAFRPPANSVASSRPAPAPQAKSAPKPEPKKKDEGNIFQQGLKFLGDTAGAAVRGVGDAAGWAVGEAVKNNPLALVSRGASGVAGMLGAPKEVTEALAIVDKGSGAVGDVAKSAVRGVGEFGAGTVEGVAQLAADPLAAAQGIGIAVSSGVDAIPVVGDLTSGAEAMVRGTSMEKVRAEKAQNRDAIWKGMVEEHQAVEGRVGSVGAWVKVGLDVGGIVKSGAVQGGKTAARVAHLADEAGEAATKAARLGDEAGSAAKAGVKPGENMASKPAAGEPVLQRQLDGSKKPHDPGLEPERPAAAKIAEDSRGYRYTKPAGRDTSRLEFHPEDVTKRIADEIKSYREKNPAKTDAVFAGETNALLDEAYLVLRAAEREGRVPVGTSKDLAAQRSTGWLISRELKAGGVQLSKETNDYLMPYEVLKANKVSPGQTVIRRETSITGGADGEAALALSRRAFEKAPPLVANGNAQVKAYGAQASDLKVLSSAIEDMRKYAPRMAGRLQEAHFEKTIESSYTDFGKRFDPDTGQKLPRDSHLSSAVGSSFRNDFNLMTETDGLVVVKHVPPGTGKKLELEYASKGEAVPLTKTPDFRLHGTIFHETAHLLDRNRAISEAADSPFLQAGKTLDRKDFVGEYAMTNPAEDFAETVRVVVQLQASKAGNILEGAPVTPALRAKLLRAAEAIGADPSVLKTLHGW